MLEKERTCCDDHARMQPRQRRRPKGAADVLTSTCPASPARFARPSACTIEPLQARRSEAKKMERLIDELDHGPQGIVALLALWQACIYRQQAWA